MNRNRFFLLMLVVALFGFQSCQDKDDEKPKTQLKTGNVTVDATDYAKWVYVSLETGKVVGTSEFDKTRSDNDWDIAFHRYDVRLNGGKSGSGKAGAYLAPGKKGKPGWDEIVTAPATGYVADKVMKMMKSPAMPPKFFDVSGSPVITGGMGQGTWVNFKHDQKQGTAVYTVTNQIFVIKTAKGKYGKLWLKQYVDANKKGGHISFKYAYQENGSKDLK